MNMSSGALALLSLATGFVIGAGIVALLSAARHAAAQARARANAHVPDGVVQMLRAMPGAAAVVDSALMVVAGSAASAEMGLVVGESITVEDLRALARAARAADGTRDARFRMRRAAGGSAQIPAEGRLVSARVTPLSTQHLLIVVEDVTEQERIEQMRYDFVANTSHELKTPVGAVSLLSEAIEHAADDPDQVRNFAVRLQGEAARLSRLTGRIMDLSRLQAADALPEPGPVSIDEVLAASIEAHQVQGDSAAVELVRGGERGLHVIGDSSMLIDAVGNLIANAIAYSPRGARVGIGVRVAGDAVDIAVSDQGIGISEADQTRVFERFYRADSARSRGTGGTGLGLAIVKHIVQRHGGDVRVWSKPGSGSTFTVRLPLLAEEAPAPAPRRRATKADRPPKADRAAKADRPGRTERAPRSERAPKAERPPRAPRPRPARENPALETPVAASSPERPVLPASTPAPENVTKENTAE